MSVNSTRRNLGKKIAEGSYGCIYTKNNKVLKVSDKKEAVVELNIATLIKNIPNWQNYYIIQEKEEFATSNFTRVRPTYQGECKIIRETSNSNLRLLSSPYGGVPVRSIEVTESFSYEKAVRHLLEAVTKLNEQGICHYDIHGGNVVDDVNGIMRLIDFGSAFLGDMADVATVKKHKYPFSPNFAAQPPELAIQNAIVEERDIQASIDVLMDKREIFRNSAEYTGITSEYARKELYFFVTSEYHATDLAWAEYYRTYWRKWDVWGLGVLFLRILQQCLFIPSLRKELWDTPLMRKKIQTLLKGCLEPDPRKRFSANDALKSWVSSS
jgi:serine/threonine protein kinase